MQEGERTEGAQPDAPLSSPLSSLPPSPHASPARKRPRLASSSPPSPADFLPRCSPGPRTSPEQAASHEGEPREEGAGVVPTKTDDNLAQDVERVATDAPLEPSTTDPKVEARVQKPGGSAPDPPVAAGDDDSGVGWLPGIEDGSAEKAQPAGEDVAEIMEAGAEAVEASDEEGDFDGDDIWLGFDETDAGFDQPQTFPSSALAPDPRLLGARQAESPTSVADEAGHEGEPRLSDFGFANLDPTGGFVFATRKPFAVSEKAMQRAKALLEAEDEPKPLADAASSSGEDSTAVSTVDLPTPARPRPEAGMPGMSTPVVHAAFAPASSPVRAAGPSTSSSAFAPSFAGFQNAAGRELKMPSEEALRRARERLDAKTPSPTKGSSTILRPARPRAGSRSSPSKDVFAVQPDPGRAIQPPAFRLNPIRDASRHEPSAAASAARLPRDSPTQRRDERHATSPGRGGQSSPVTELYSSIHVPPSREPYAAKGDVVDQDSTVDARARPTEAAKMVATPLRPVAGLSAAGRRLSDRPSMPGAATSGPSGFRPPLLAGQVTTPANATTPSRAAPAAPTASPLPFKVPGPSANPLHPSNRRLNFGMTPRAKPFHLANTRRGTPASVGKSGAKGFVTPFKGGLRPQGLTPMGLKDKLAASGVGARQPNHQSAAKRRSGGLAQRALDLTRRDKAKIFDLERPEGERYDLTFGMHPQTHYYEQLEELGLPKEVLDMDFKSGAAYTFPCGRSVEAACEALQALVAERMPEERDLVTLPWVKNHWTLILWKLASYVRSRPDLLREWWSFERVMHQLRYRYEREINRAERSVIKRIQEHDSDASLPMVLCVSQIRWEEAPDSAEAPSDKDRALIIAGLELTDGWYRIRSNVDGALRSACERGKIVVGCKIAVSGAKLDASGNEGVEVLQALNRSQLVISGNSTCLAPWHAKLGAARGPFVAGLSSLSSSGGLVPLVDVLVERVYPYGYIDLKRGRGTDTWGEEEEVTRAEEWRTGRSRIEAKLAEETEKETSEEDVLVELLQEASERIDLPGKQAPPGFPGEEPDEILDRLESASNKQVVLRQLRAEQIRDVLALAQENAQASRFRAVEDLQKQLAERYPPREVRGFRVLRVIDAREGAKTGRRSAQLTVWDAQLFEADFFKEGQRYMVSNLVPKGSWRPKDREITLTTRRDSKWKKV